MSKFLFGCVFLAIFFAASSNSAQAAQHQSASNSQTAVIAAPNFAPLDEWKAAVLSGDLEKLKGLYSAAPPATTVTAKGEDHDPSAEPQFWAAARSAGLVALTTKIATVDSPQPGVQRVMFALEANMKPPSAENKAFAAISQYWLQQNGKWVIVATQRTGLARLPQPVELLMPQPKEDDSGPGAIYPNPAEAKPDIAAALAAAARDHKRVLLDFGGNWCGDCHVLDATFHYPEVARLLGPNYEVVHVNIGEYTENLDLAEKYQIPLKRGVPSLAVLDAQGNLLVSQKNGDFENTTKIGLADVESFLEHWKPAK